MKYDEDEAAEASRSVSRHFPPKLRERARELEVALPPSLAPRTVHEQREVIEAGQRAAKDDQRRMVVELQQLMSARCRAVSVEETRAEIAAGEAGQRGPIGERGI